MNIALKRSNAGKIPEESKEESDDSTPETQQEESDYDKDRGNKEK